MSVAVAPAASAAAQNGYVFNDAWTLQNPGSATTQYTGDAYNTNATNSASSSLPSSQGPIAITAQFTSDPARNPGASSLQNGTNQSAYGGQPAMFTGSPTPANLPALGLVTNGTTGCGGVLGSAGHQNFNGVCTVGTLTINFSKPVTDMTMDISGLGGSAFRADGALGRGSFNSTVWTITSPGVTFASPSTGKTNLSVTDTVMQVQNRNTNNLCNANTQERPGTAFASPTKDFAGCGSVVLKGTFTSVTFQLGSMATPYSAFPAATYSTGSGFFGDNGTPNHDGINGLNVTMSERILLPTTTTNLYNADLQRVSFRLPQTGVLGDRVWADANGNGVQDAGEANVAGVRVALLNENGQPVNDANGNPITTTTDANGNYRFTDLPLGNYKVKFSNLPAGQSFTTPGAGGDPTKDSDANPATGESGVVALTSDAPQNLNVDAGILPTGSIGDRVWYDDNNNGIQDGTETGAPGVKVDLLNQNGQPVLDANGQPITTTTDANGNYLFPNLPLGSYRVKVTPPAGANFSPALQGGNPANDSNVDNTGVSDVVTITPANPNNTTVDAGLVLRGSLGDKVWLDQNGNGVQDANEPGIQGAKVDLLDENGQPVNDANGQPITTTTDANGNYSFTNLPLGKYKVKVSGLSDGLAFTTKGAGTDTTKDSNINPATGESDVVELTGAKPVDNTVDAGVVVSGSIGDKVWLDNNGDGIQDPNEPGVPGVKVDLLDGNGQPVLDANGQPVTTTTDADGNYLFPNLPAGDYKVKVNAPADRKFTSQASGTDREKDSNVGADGVSDTVTINAATPNRRDVDAGLVVNGSLGDKVWLDQNANGVQDPNEPGVGGVTVHLLDGNGQPVNDANGQPITATTDAQGNYLFSNLPAGTYKVKVDLPADRKFTSQASGTDREKDSNVGTDGVSDAVTIDATTPNRRDVDAGVVVVGSLGDKVWLDNNSNGVQDAGEPGVAGVTVHLLDGNGQPVNDANGNPITTTTDADGNYLFPNLPAGDYKVKVDLPADRKFTQQAAGADREKDSNVGTDGVSDTVTINENTPNRRDVDAGVVVNGSLGDKVWFDLNGDGIQDPNEPGVPNVTVHLLDGNGQPVNDANGQPITTTTDAQGNYLFSNLPAGDYKVKVDLPADRKFAPQAAGADREKDSNVGADGVSDTVAINATTPNRRDVDAGVIVNGSIGDKIWLDQNGDGIQDPNEPGVPGVKVDLLDGNGQPVNDANGQPITTTTDAQGNYLFPNLPAGTYKVKVNLPEDRKFTSQASGTDREKDSNVGADGVSDAITIDQTTPNRRDVDAGVVVVGSLGDKVWLDNNSNGVQDAGEPGVPNVTVHLLDGNGQPVNDANGNPITTTTDADGNYLFSNLPAGDYKVKVDLPADRKFTQQAAGADREKDSNVAADGVSDTVTINENTPNRRDVDAGVVVNGSVGDKVWLDQNGDGIQDPNEPGVPNVTVHLFDGAGQPVLDANGQPVITTTDADGNYLFPNLPAGDYKVKVDLPDGYKTTPAAAGTDREKDSNVDPTGLSDTVTVNAATPNRRDVDAGLQVNGSLGDKVWLDRNGDGIQDPNEPGVAGVKVDLLDGNGQPVLDANGQPITTTTDAQGNYLFSNLPAGTYKVKVELPEGYKTTSTASGADREKDSNVGTDGISDAVTIDAANPNRRDVDAGLVVNGTIGDTIWRDDNRDGVQDPNEPGMPGLKVTLLDKDGNVVKETTTDENGKYQFTDVPAGDYKVKVEVPDGFKPTDPAAGGDPTKDSNLDPTGVSDTVTVDENNRIRQDIDGGLVVNGSIGDKVWFDRNSNGVQDAGEPGVAGVTVHLLDGNGQPVNDANGNPITTTTDADGNYLFPNLPAGDYKVKVDLPADRKFAPQAAGTDREKDSNVGTDGVSDTVSVTPATPNRRDVDAGVVVNGSVGDKVWLDQNGDGIQDPNEPGIANVKVDLLDGNGQPVLDANGQPVTTTTDADGNYLFPNLPAGTYKVKVELPEGYKTTSTAAGTDREKDSNVGTDGISDAVTVDENTPNRRDVDAGLVVSGTIGDTIWRDDNRDGVQDPNEPGMPGLKVTLLDKDGNVLRETTTDENGKYQFTDVPTGDYKVKVEVPDGFKPTNPNAGGDPAKDSNLDPTGVSDTVTVDQNNRIRQDIDGGLVVNGSIGDKVWLDQNGNGVQDPNEPGVPNVTVHLLDKDGNPVIDPNGQPVTTTTDADGNYLFPNLPAGDYKVKVDLPADRKFAPQAAGDDRTKDSNVGTDGVSDVVSVTPATPNRRDVDAGVVVNGSIGDKIWLDQNGDGIQDPNEPGVPGVKVSLLDGNGQPVKDANGNPITTTTDENGNYLFPNLPAGDYKIKVDPPKDRGFTKQTAGNDPEKDSDFDLGGVSKVVTINENNPNPRSVDAGLIVLGTIGDTVWRDDNNNGIQDPKEPGVPGITVKLLDKDGKVIRQTTTDQNGKYQFTDVPAGDYSVQIDVPKDAKTSKQGQGSDRAKDSDINVAGKSGVITIDENNPHHPDIDAGLVFRGSIGDTIWVDRNGNGVQDPGEPGVPGVKVTLVDKDGNPIPGIKPVVTDKDGKYRFTDLPPGDYRIKVELPPGFKATGVKIGNDRGADSNIDANGLSDIISLVPGAMDVTDVDAGLIDISKPVPPAPTKPLPNTGVGPWLPATLGASLFLLLAGGLLLIIMRRRRETR
ncbi:SdrD B-like domain-containing protein [Psychromicrobium sp. YIM B11713]|uniref:SdrD B-like domain-containing protein n=1 Tax=Psychromicrobium sp. YIM B11713 TaxID=3145233 RepID=UPI00374F361B